MDVLSGCSHDGEVGTTIVCAVSRFKTPLARDRGFNCKSGYIDYCDELRQEKGRRFNHRKAAGASKSHGAEADVAERTNRPLA